MFNLQDAYTNISIDDIYSKVSEYELWKYYCHNFEVLDRSFKSELYRDNNPSCRIYLGNNNRLLYKDFGTGESFTVLDYIKQKYHCTFKEALNIIGNDFKIIQSNRPVNKESRILLVNDESIIRSKTRIDIITQPFSIVDFDYWNQYEIPLTLLEDYNIFACKYVYLIKNGKVITFNYTKDNPIYAYRFVYEGEYSYKIYFPKADKKYKWLNNCNSNIIQGIDQLSSDNDLIILTKSLKDVLCYRLLGYNAIALQSETNKLPIDLKVIVNYDNDEEGIKGTNSLVEKYNFKYFYIEGAKDLSDYIKANNLSKAKQLIDKKIKQLC
jgi:hypothetical protein